jgi:hypothetical protein
VLRGGVTPQQDADFEAGFRTQSAMDAVFKASASKRWEPIATRLE